MLSATSLSNKSCKKIQSRAINASLTKCSFSRKMDRAVVFGSPWFGGMGWRHLYFEQGIKKVLSLIKHLRTPGPFHSLLQISLQWYQLIAGVSFSPFRYPNFKLPYLDHPWFDGIRTFLRLCSAYLVLPETPLPQPQRWRDRCIMNGILDQDLSQTTQMRINCCPLYLQVDQLSCL